MWTLCVNELYGYGFRSVWISYETRTEFTDQNDTVSEYRDQNDTRSQV